jgi:cyclic dehypoxanthinyl futalosine synthase
MRTAGRTPAQRNTLYEIIEIHEDPANDPVDDGVVSHFASIAVDRGVLPILTDS